MAAVTHTLTAGQVGIRAHADDFPWRRPQAVIDCLSTATNGYNVAATDIAQMIDVRADEIVLLVVLEVVTAEGGTMTLDVGDGADPDCFLDGVDGNTTAGNAFYSVQTYTAPSTTNADVNAVFGTVGIAALIGGRSYAAADTIDITFVNAGDAGKYRLTALIAAMAGSQTVGNFRTAAV